MCVYGDGLLQEVVGGERPEEGPPTHHPITALLVQETQSAREGGEMGGIKGSGRTVRVRRELAAVMVGGRRHQ